MVKKITLILTACFLLSIGGLIYLCFRPPTLLLFRWLDLIRFDYAVFQNIDMELPSFIVNNLNNAIFVIFGYIIVYVIWENNRFYFLFYTLIITILSIIYEIITKDISDIITISVSYLICLLLYFRFYGVKHEK